MSKTNNLTDFLTDIADALRYVKDDNAARNPQLFSNEIRELKTSDIVVDVASETTLSGEDLNKMQIKKNNLMQAVNNTIIDGESIYKITVYKNESDTTVLDILFYSQEGDIAGYYYVLSEIDNYLSKVYI